jgi:hypothetical protein
MDPDMFVSNLDRNYPTLLETAKYKHIYGEC